MWVAMIKVKVGVATVSIGILYSDMFAGYSISTNWRASTKNNFYLQTYTESVAEGINLVH